MERNTPERAGNFISVPVAAGAKIYAGRMVAVNSNGFAVPAADEEGLSAAGRAEESVNNFEGEDGDVYVLIKKGVFQYNNDPSNPVAKLFADCYISDDATVRAFDDTAAAANSVAGTAYQIEPDGVWVKF